MYFLSTCFAFILGVHNISIFSNNRSVYSMVVFLFSLLSFRVANDCSWTLHPAPFSYVCSDYLIKFWISNSFFEYMIWIIINGAFHLELISRYIRFIVPPFVAEIFFASTFQSIEFGFDPVTFNNPVTQKNNFSFNKLYWFIILKAIKFYDKYSNM